MKILVLLLLTLGLTACGGGYNPDKDPLNNAVELGQSHYFDLGQGRGLMAQAANSVNAGSNFEISFSIEDQGIFTLTVFADNGLNNGLNISFHRDGSSMTVFASVQGQLQDWTPQFASVDVTHPITLTLDVHNNERPAHILVWEGPKNSSLNHRNAIYNSGEDSLDLGYDGSPGNGSGRYWGFQLQNAQIIKAQLSSPQDQH